MTITRDTGGQHAARGLVKIAGSLQPGQLTVAHVAALCATWAQSLSRTTLYHRTLGLRHLLRHLGRPDLQVPKARPPRPRTKIATPEDIQRLLSAAKPWLRTILQLAVDTGLRRSDCVRITPANYDPERRAITIHQKKTGDPVTIPASDTLSSLFTAAGSDPATRNTPIYAILAGRTYSESAIDSAWNRLKDTANVDRQLWIHDLRRTLAVGLYEVSKDIRVVQQVLGHANLRTTAGYLHHSDPAKLRPFLEALWTPKGPVQ